MPISEVFNVDCIAYMQTLPDKFFDLAITDPPYGIGAGDKNNKHRTKPSRKNSYTNYSVSKTKRKKWDNNAPDMRYFNELFRVSSNQIIFGANYFCNYIPQGKGWIFWDKRNGIDNDFSDGEFAFSSKGIQSRMFSCSQFDGLSGGKNRIHPTQKPIALYKWLIEKYAKAGDKIFDSHMGSQSSRIAAFNMGFDYWGCELDEEYFNDGNKRFIRETMQQSLFTPTATKAEITQTTIF